MLLADPKTGAGNTSHQRGSDRACGERSAARIGAALIYSLWAARCFLLFPTVICCSGVVVKPKTRGFLRLGTGGLAVFLRIISEISGRRRGKLMQVPRLKFTGPTALC